MQGAHYAQSVSNYTQFVYSSGNRGCFAYSSCIVSDVTPNGTAIRAIRRMQGISLRDLARKTGFTRSYLSRLERGLAGASESTIRRIAEVLAVPPADITRGDPCVHCPNRRADGGAGGGAS
jgi:ribosome-binding protein aMBF1 (putative translation factor)